MQKNKLIYKFDENQEKGATDNMQFAKKNLDAFLARYSKKFNDDPLRYLFALTANLDGIYCRQTGFPPLLSW